MLTLIISIYTIFTIISIYTSLSQISFVNKAKNQEAVLLKKDEFIKAGDYTIVKEKLSIFGSFLNYSLFLYWIVFGIKILSQNIHFEDEAFFNIAVVMGFVIINSLFSLPIAYYEKFIIDQEFGFNKSTKALFIKDTLISFVMTVVFGSLVTWGIYLIISNLSYWWLWSFAFIFVVIVLINMLFPTIRAMFFDKLTPLDNEELASQIKELMDKTGFVSSGVFISDASKRDARLNAYFGGLGKTKRVVLFDTLIQKLSTKELLAVLGHELGHFAHGDIYKNIALVGAMLFAMFGIFGNLPDALYTQLQLAKEPFVIMILLLLFMPILGLIMMPIMGIVSRHNEYEADKTGSQLAGENGSFELANALKKLVTENKSFPLSHPVYIFFHYTHPPVLQRLKALGVDVKELDSTCQQ